MISEKYDLPPNRNLKHCVKEVKNSPHKSV